MCQHEPEEGELLVGRGHPDMLSSLDKLTSKFRRGERPQEAEANLIDALAAQGCSEDFEDFNHEPSVSGRFKIYCERLAGQQLVWWPFKEPDRPVSYGMRRLAYQCVRSS